MTPGRLHLGFHFGDLETSLMLMRATIRFVKIFPGHRISEHLPSLHPLRRGRFFIAKDSLVSAGEILEIYKCLKQVYSDMIDEDPSNMVFGPPEMFYRILDKTEFEYDVDASKVLMGIETSEHFLDCKKFQTSLESRLRNHKNVKIYEFTELVDIRQAADSRKHRWSLIFNKGEKRRVTFSCDYVVNSTWCQIEKLNRMAGFLKESFPISNRLKAVFE
ncbi:uncharacterized protein LOC124443426 [Xenia sp. Carnegie-2017]|uniref:uncharacterized protein LOC124443426 n=1 Tax=Xenia sp. Carnegie-2017 TaxID=2897299 RepID=UPI001F03B72D|nr:uncharacterized protein LOC124443426 [Xenia sp. Carnegie-2017]